jgi:hypothetical protein
MQVAREVMVAKQPSRHMTYYDLSDALAQPGCAVCRLVANAVDRYLRGLLHESVNNPGVRERLRASSGFCREHSWQLQRRGDSLGIAILWRDLLTQGVQPENERRRRTDKRRNRMCPACEIALEAQYRYLETLLEHLEAGALRDEYVASAGLCLSHLRAALGHSPSGARDFLLASESEKLRRLVDELSEIIRKNDYRFRDEPWGPEKDAWIRATRKLAGESLEE